MTWRPTVVMSAQDEAAMKEVLGGQTTAAVLTPVLMG
jgi:hypothetical protein